MVARGGRGLHLLAALGRKRRRGERGRVRLRHARAYQLDLKLLRRRRAVRSLFKDEMAAAEERIKLRSVEAEHFAHLLRLGRAEAARTLRVQAAERV